MSSTTISSSSPPPDSWEPLYMSTIAGLSTCIGAAVVFCQPQNDQGNTKIVPPKTMAFSLALAGSVMITVSVISILPEVLMDDKKGEESSYRMIKIVSWDMFYRILFFSLGCALYFGLSSLLHVPEPEELLDQVLIIHQRDNDTNDQIKVTEESNDLGSKETELVSLISGSTDETLYPDQPLRGRRNNVHHVTREMSPGDNNGKRKTPKKISDSENANNNGVYTFGAWTTGEDLNSKEKKKAWRVAILLFVSLLVHNFPEGLAVAASALESSKLGVTVTIGIMVHNIPEGIAIAIPCLAARPDQPWLSFILASVSGLAEPMGAFVALLFLRDIKGNKLESQSILNLENILSFVAGIMVMVSLWELFPEAKRHATDTTKYFWYGTISGILIMVLTELYLP